MDRLAVLRKAKDYAYEQIDVSSCLTDECLANLQKAKDNSDESICLLLAKKFLEEAALDLEDIIEEIKNITKEVENIVGDDDGAE